MLAKEGCQSALEKILDPENIPSLEKNELVEALLQFDNAGWSPLMRVLQADKDENVVMELLLRFLDENIDALDIEKIVKPSPEVKYLSKGLKHNLKT